MGYAYYDTPAGPAGYSVPDICHHKDCFAAIDRGLSYLCGRSPGWDDEAGCGRWFCGEHLMYTGEPGLSRCDNCWKWHQIAEYERGFNEGAGQA